MLKIHTTPEYRAKMEAVAQEYINVTVFTMISLAKLAKKHGIPLDTLEKRCKKEHWCDKRGAYMDAQDDTPVEAEMPTEAEFEEILRNIRKKLRR